MNNNHRILLNIAIVSDDDLDAYEVFESTYWRINNILNGTSHFPNIAEICDYCTKVNKGLGAYIRNRCLDLRKEAVFFDPATNNPNSIRNVIADSERKNIRILLYPGNREDIDDLKMHETTHNMIVQFDKTSMSFNATEPHNNPPSFYQVCNSEDIAIAHFEALLVDACMCHYLGVSDVASHHDDKQHISSEKVEFIKEITRRKNIDYLSSSTEELLRYVASKLTDTTPYVSFFSIFSIAPYDVFGNLPNSNVSYFEEYCKLWNEFQKWYFKKHGRLFLKNEEVVNPISTVFDRNKYHGQVSPTEITDEIKFLLTQELELVDNPPFGLEHRYAVVIISHIPDNPNLHTRLCTLFSGQLHQAKWNIFYWNEISKFRGLESFVEVIPFIIM